MANIDVLVKAWDTWHWELGEGFKGLPDGDVWVRPHPALLSIGELAAHISLWESINVTGQPMESPLIVREARYYTESIGAPIALELGSEAVYQEVQRIHQAAKAAYLAAPRDSEEQNPYRDSWTWGQTMEYMVFHVAYHTGQVYSVRHLLGHTPVDN